MTKPLNHWNYYISLETKVSDLSQYIEFHEDNYDVYSIELAQLLLSICSEIEVVFKSLSALFGSKLERAEIADFLPIADNLLYFNETLVTVGSYDLLLKPWDSWSKAQAPKWWSSHNKVKHNRATKYKEASLKNVLNALSALFSLNIYLNHHTHSRQCEYEPMGLETYFQMLRPQPRLLIFSNPAFFGFKNNNI